MSQLSDFLAELKRRRVFRVATFYGGIAFVIVQIIDGTFEVVGVPPWVSRLFMVLLAAGFPVAGGPAWVFDITPEGIARTSRLATTGHDVTLDASKGGRSTGKPLSSNRALIVVGLPAVVIGV